jgi:cytochrome c5
MNRGMTNLLRYALGCVAALTVAAASGAERTGKQVVDAACVACHGKGVNGAPKIGDRKAWSALEARGLSALEQSALQGIRNMPAHGGNPGFTDVEIARAIAYMVNRSGGRWNEPVSRTSTERERSGADVVKTRCGQCHSSGRGGAPKVGDQDAWIPRLRSGLDVLVRSAIRGHGGMPARGGFADLTDGEVKNAIVYMINRSSAAK